MKEDLLKILASYKSEKDTPLYKAIAELAENVSVSQNSKTDFEKLFYEAATINLLIDPATGKIIEANQTALNYYGYSPKEMSELNIADINVLTEKEIQVEMNRAEAQERNYFLFRHRLKAGEVRHVEVYSTPVEVHGRVLLHSVIFDIEEKITTRYKANRFQTAIEQSPTSVVITDLEGTIEYVNPKFTELTGYSSDEAIGKNPRILKSERTAPDVYVDMWKTIADGQVWTGEFINKHKDGSHFWERATMAPLYQDDLHIGYIAIKENITERKLNEFKVSELNHELEVNLEELNSAYEELNIINERLNESNEILKLEREQFLSLLNSISEPIYVADKNSYEILFANKAINDTVGRDITGEKCYNALQNNKYPCSFCKHTEIFEQRKICYWEHFNEALEKDYYIIDRAIKWLDGREAHFQMSINISQLKEVEKELRIAKSSLTKRSEELAELNATKDKFFSIISHDLKNPFNAIMGLSGFLYNKIDKYDTATIKNYAFEINKASKNYYKLLQNLLEWANSQMNRVSFNPKSFNLYDLVDEVSDSLSSQSKEKGINICIRIPKETEIYADRNMLSTVIRNLLSNAIKFSYDKARIDVISKELSKQKAVSVIDYGVGIPDATQKKLFQISEKVSTPGTNKEKGTGLGLLLCKEFLEKHGGDMKVNSTEGKGSEFTFMLPKA